MSERGGAGRPLGRESEQERRARTAARRAVIRRHHPDVGGDAEVLRRELAALAAPVPMGEDVTLHPPGRWQPLARAGSRARRVVRRRTRQVRSRLPQGWPGARRWTDL